MGVLTWSSQTRCVPGWSRDVAICRRKIWPEISKLARVSHCPLHVADFSEVVNETCSSDCPAGIQRVWCASPSKETRLPRIMDMPSRAISCDAPTQKPEIAMSENENSSSDTGCGIGCLLVIFIAFCSWNYNTSGCAPDEDPVADYDNAQDVEVRQPAQSPPIREPVTPSREDPPDDESLEPTEMERARQDLEDHLSIPNRDTDLGPQGNVVRTWTNISDQQDVDASIAWLGETRIGLERADGSVIDLRINDLSESDQRTLRIHFEASRRRLEAYREKEALLRQRLDNLVRAHEARIADSAKSESTSVDPGTSKSASHSLDRSNPYKLHRLRPNELFIRREDFGNDWPFTVSEGVLRCQMMLHPAGFDTGVTFTTRGKTYAVNGVAKGTERFHSLEEIWRTYPGGGYVNEERLIQVGLSLCGN